jgi:hypothetical protein
MLHVCMNDLYMHMNANEHAIKCFSLFLALKSAECLQACYGVQGFPREAASEKTLDER